MSSSAVPYQYPSVKLPHPFLTSYSVRAVEETTPIQLVLELDGQPQNSQLLNEPLHLDTLTWLHLSFRPDNACPPNSDNSSWARARRSPETTFQWTGKNPPSLGQVWNVIHAIYLAHPAYEYFRLSLLGVEQHTVRTELLSTGVAVKHPLRLTPIKDATMHSEELLILRSAFWQGAASPMGPRPIWAVGSGTNGLIRRPLAQYPIMPESHHFTTKFPDELIHIRHPIRRPKPHPGSIAYSRYIPELDEHFSLEVVNWEDLEHLALFSKWQNDPRVAQGWNETGTLEQHRQYLRRLHFDPHVLCLFGRFDESRFAYFELYWSKVGLHPSEFSFMSMLIQYPLHRKITTALITMLEITTEGVTLLSARYHSEAPKE